MPKTIELTVELEIQRVSCPGVWLCQDGRVSLTVYTLGTSYQTCLLPPLFPLLFRDIFYFRKRFQQSCALNNMCCMMKDESLYCELVQWCDNCNEGDCVVLAQYLGALNDVLFPPTLCSNDGVDLLMRRSKNFPGILSPKIEVATKIRIDEVWNKTPNDTIHQTCDCSPEEKIRNKAVCHTTPYHRFKCNKSHRPRSTSRGKPRTQSVASKSCCSLAPKKPEASCDCPISPKKPEVTCECPIAPKQPEDTCECPRVEREDFRAPCGRRQRTCPEYDCYNVNMKGPAWINDMCESDDYEQRNFDSQFMNHNADLQKSTVRSKFILEKEFEPERKSKINNFYHKVSPCVCEICKRYHELFHKTAK